MSAQEPDIEQLNQLETLLSDNDVAGLRAYLDRNPELLEGDTEIARLLEEFLRASEELPAYLRYDDEHARSAPGDDHADTELGDLGPGAGGSIY